MSEFRDVVRNRRMTRAFTAVPVAPGLIDELVELAARSPSAGKTQGWHLVVLEGADTARFWDCTLPPPARDDFAWRALLDAPVIALPFADPDAYLERYARPDKAGSASALAGGKRVGAGLGESTEAWPVPFWTVDTSFAVMTLLLGAQDLGLGALFFGVFDGEAELRNALGVPESLQLIGAIALGYPDDARQRPVRLANRPRRRTPEQIIHRRRW